ncbi:MAG: tRNA pseudouridine(38-40) synthase TruA [Myxococcota bacterium]
MPRNIRLLLEYDGSAYVGWQLQENGPSIQGELLRALGTITGEKPVLQVAGRTDAGVHALGQVTSFRLAHRIPSASLAPALNGVLPRDISVHRADDVPDDFDARFSSHSKRYRYRVYRADQPAALDHQRAWHRRFPLDLVAMRRAAAHLVGELDFESFRSVQCDAAHARRRMLSIEIASIPRPPLGEHIDLVFHANAYCRHMVRILSGTLVEVGMGKRNPDDVATILVARDRRHAGVTAPPHGLTLLEVLYGP